MFLDRSIEEDNKMVESWEGDAKGMPVFVGLPITSHPSAYNQEIIECSTLCCGRGIAHVVCPEHSAEPTAHLSLLSRTYLSATIYPTEWVPSFHPIELVQPHRAIHSAHVGRLGQRALVHESGHESYLRHIGDIGTAVGASLSNGRLPTFKLLPPQESTYPCIL
jgi:hypothetical protein